MAKDASEVINETAEAQKPNQPQPTMERLIADMSDREILELIGKLSKRIDKTTQREKDSKVKSWIAENKFFRGAKRIQIKYPNGTTEEFDFISDTGYFIFVRNEDGKEGMVPKASFRSVFVLDREEFIPNPPKKVRQT
jgi:hypothetical protein